MPDPEPLPAIIRVRVTNPRAKRAGESGWIVNTEDGPHLTYVDVLFEEGGDVYRYEKSELELCLP